MDIRNEHIFLVKEDIPLSRIAKIFKPQDKTGKAFLSGSALRSYEGSLAMRLGKPTVVAIAICTAPKGETLQGVLKAISASGWSYGTLADWYRYHTNFPFLEGDIISTPGTTYLDENFSEWITFVSLGKDISFLQKITNRGKRKVIPKIFLKPLVPLLGFQSERRILVSRAVEEENVPQLKKTEGPSV